MKSISKKLFVTSSKHANISEKVGFIKNIEKLREIVANPDKNINTIHLGFSSNYSSLATVEVSADKFLNDYATNGILIDSKNFYSDMAGKNFFNNNIHKKLLWKPDLNTIRNISWLKNNSILIFGDIYNSSTGELSEVSPRGILKRKLKLFENQKLTLNCASELEYYLYQKSYSNNIKKGLENLKPIGSAPEDYLIQQGDLLEYLNEEFRKKLKLSGISIETTKGESSIGQHEINMKYSEALEQSDNALVLKSAMKAISESNDASVSFMAKPHIDLAGSSCHLHLSVYDENGKNIFVGNDLELTEKTSCSNNLKYFLGGIMKYSLDTFIMFAPTINSYKRYKSFSWAPTNLDSWSYDNRTSPFRICGSGNNLRIEYRIPGGDANQYLSYSAVIASGLKGLKEKISPPELFKGDSYSIKDFKRPPIDLNEALHHFKNSEFIREYFTEKEVNFLSCFYQNEVEEFENSVTEMERKRYFNLI